MIALSTLAANIETALNKKKSFNFKIFSDTGKFKKAVRNNNTVTEYINGELRLIGSETSNLVNGSVFATQSCKLNLIVRLEDEEESENVTDVNGNIIYSVMGSREKIEKVRAVLDGVFSQNTTEELKDGSKTYLVSTVYQMAESGERSQVQILGNSFTFTVYIYYMFVENGINTRDTVFILDGVMIPYQSVTVYRTPTMDGNVYADSKNGATKNISSQSNFSVSFELPALEDTTTRDMLDYLLDGQLNQAHFLTFTIGNKTQNYLVTYGENKAIGETVKNVGQTLTLVECPDEYDLISFSDKYFIYKYVLNSPSGLAPQLTNAVFNVNSKIFATGVKNAPINRITVNKGDIVVCTYELKGPIPGTMLAGFERIQ